MEALYLLKFWRPTTNNSETHKENHPSSGKNTGIPITDDEFEEGEDSFFELELTVPDFDTINESSSNNNTTNIKSNHLPDKDSNIFDSKGSTPLHKASDNISPSSHTFFQQQQQQSSLPLSSSSKATDHLFSKRKILPIEPISSSKPQSPISLLKSSAPRFKILMFKKSKSMASNKTGETEHFKSKNNNKDEGSRKLFTVKFKLEDAAATNLSFFTKQNSLRKSISNDSSDGNDTSKRFSKEMIQKYLKLIKPLYIKVSKKQNDRIKFSGELSAGPPASSPAMVPAKEKQGNFPAGIRVVSRSLGKSKSASATTRVSPPIVNRRDDSLLLQHDGIQSAILHCKNSFNSSRDSSLMSKFASDPLHDKSMVSPRMSSDENGIN